MIYFSHSTVSDTLIAPQIQRHLLPGLRPARSHLQSARAARRSRKELLGGREPVFSPSTRTWLRIIALSDALRLSAPLCTTTLIRLLPWLMATSPPLEEKVNLYLIVTLPFRPGSFHHFFIHSASISAALEMQKSLNLFRLFCQKLLKIWTRKRPALFTSTRER